MTAMISVAALACLLAATGTAVAQAAPDRASPWWLHAGPVQVQFHTKADVRVGGAPLPGAGVDASSNTTLGLEIGHDMTPNIAARLTIGVPPTTRLSGTGPLAGAGELGRVKYGPAVLSATWSFDGLGAFRPYLGAGVNYTIALESPDGAITSLKVKNAFGSVLQAGFDMPLGPRWGLFVDVKKVFLKTTADGWVGPAPAHASVQLDPLLIHGGVSYRF
ncbi:OmpW/AlkL family protein [Aquabacterium sp.]|uniref:OmpW/AlkL family protein n=1 Tax=Aquabacterium sp. TaxID=1872578 RepID=UPI002D14F34B|nr:OmpW family outer membrane protein [Aquabacterium sp.]HSW05134.1 OmpW family outer membrane protein [Aquabacterium sp.]